MKDSDIILKLSQEESSEQHLENWTMRIKSNDPWDSFLTEKSVGKKSQDKTKKHKKVITQALWTGSKISKPKGLNIQFS